MDIEDLSKSQLILLTLLVSFVTSIATGVITVSLLDVAPPTVTQTVNQIVDHTIETVATQVPIPTPSKPGPSQPSSEDLLTNAIGAAAARTVSIYAGATSTPPVATGVYVPKARAVLTATMAGLPRDAHVAFPDGTFLEVSKVRSGATITIYGFADAATLPNAPSPILVAASTLKQGETIVAITSDRSAVRGIISKVDDAGIHTDLPQSVPAGAAAVDLSGNVVGVSLGGSLFAVADKATALLSATSTPSGS